MLPFVEAHCLSLTISNSDVENVTAFAGKQIRGVCSTGCINDTGGIHVAATCSSVGNWNVEATCKREFYVYFTVVKIV